MNSLFVSSLFGVVLGAALIGGVAYLYPSQGQPRSTLLAPASAGFAAKGAPDTTNLQTLDSFSGNQSSLIQLLAVIGGPAILGAAVLLLSRRTS